MTERFGHSLFGRAADLLGSGRCAGRVRQWGEHQASLPLGEDGWVPAACGFPSLEKATEARQRHGLNRSHPVCFILFCR